MNGYFLNLNCIELHFFFYFTKKSPTSEYKQNINKSTYITSSTTRDGEFSENLGYWKYLLEISAEYNKVFISPFFKNVRCCQNTFP